MEVQSSTSFTSMERREASALSATILRARVAKGSHISSGDDEDVVDVVDVVEVAAEADDDDDDDDDDDSLPAFSFEVTVKTSFIT